MLRASQLPAEVEEGNKEYKFKLTNMSTHQLTHRITQLHWRLNEGKDNAIYEIGVLDDGYPLGLSDEELEESLSNLQTMATAVGCTLLVKHIMQGDVGKTAQVVMHREDKYVISPTHVHIAVCGEVDSGKSTLVSVLLTGNLDNGHGLARNQIVRHNHELETGRTSSISHHSVCFSDSGDILSNGRKNKSNRLRSLSEAEIAEQTHKLLVFADLAGHQKYFKTALQGFLGREPDMCLLTISAKRGIQIMTREHLGVAVALKIPLMIVITKVDAATDKTLASILKDVHALLSAAGRNPLLLGDSSSSNTTIQEDRASAATSTMLTVPIFQVSSVSGTGLEDLTSYLFRLSSNQKSWDELRLQSVEIRVLEQYKYEDEGCDEDDNESCSQFEFRPERKKRSRSFECGSSSAVIVMGIVKTGSAAVADILLYGPDKSGVFTQVVVASIQINRVPVKTATAGQCATLLLRRHTKDRGSSSSLDQEQELDEEVTLFASTLSETLLTAESTPRHSAGGAGEAADTVGAGDTGGDLASVRDTTRESSYTSLTRLSPEPTQPASTSTSISTGVFAFPPPVSSRSTALSPTPTPQQQQIQSQSQSQVSRQQQQVEEDEWTVDDDQELKGIWDKRVGMVLVSPLSRPCACWLFTAELLILNHPSVIRVNYEPVVHAENVMQSARLMSFDTVQRKQPPSASSQQRAVDESPSLAGTIDGLVVGDKALCRFRFLYQPEYILRGAAIVIREGRTRGVGRVVHVELH